MGEVDGQRLCENFVKKQSYTLNLKVGLLKTHTPNVETRSRKLLPRPSIYQPVRTITENN
jgi:hypothetical protein